MATNENQGRVTLRDIAKAVGKHFTTVSLALRNDPRLLAKTRLHIQSVARSLGYVPDPVLASLSSYRRQLRPPRYRGTLAWITNHPLHDEWRRKKNYLGFFEGAVLQAQVLGYRLEEFWMQAAGMTSGRSTYILRARGIDGLLIAPQPPTAPPLPIEWRHFSAVALGYSVRSPLLNVTCNHQCHSTRLAMRNLLARGYARVGFVDLLPTSARVDDNWLAGYLVEQFSLPPANRIAPLRLQKWDEAAVVKWITQTKPDAIITENPTVIAAARRCGLRVPQDLGIAFMGDPELGGKFAGIDEIPNAVGASAVNMLVDMIRHSERGIPQRPRQLLLEGKWVDGASVRGRPTSGPNGKRTLPKRLRRKTKSARK